MMTKKNNNMIVKTCDVVLTSSKYLALFSEEDLRNFKISCCFSHCSSKLSLPLPPAPQLSNNPFSDVDVDADADAEEPKL